MPRAYIPLRTVVNPPPLDKFSNGVELVSSDVFKPSNLDGWEQVFSLVDLRELREWHLALACNWDAGASDSNSTSAVVRLANANLALQVAAPIGTYLSVCIR